MFKYILQGIASIGEGFASIFDSFFDEPKTYKELTGYDDNEAFHRDMEAIRSDWEKIGIQVANTAFEHCDRDNSNEKK